MHPKTWRTANPLLILVSVALAWQGSSAALSAQTASASDVFRAAAPSGGRLVLVDAKGDVAGSATSFVVGDNGLVATNYHRLVDEEDGLGWPMRPG